MLWTQFDLHLVCLKLKSHFPPTNWISMTAFSKVKAIFMQVFFNLRGVQSNSHHFVFQRIFDNYVKKKFARLCFPWFAVLFPFLYVFIFDYLLKKIFCLLLCPNITHHFYLNWNAHMIPCVTSGDTNDTFLLYLYLDTNNESLMVKTLWSNVRGFSNFKHFYFHIFILILGFCTSLMKMEHSYCHL